jgi:hypothetical protein
MQTDKPIFGVISIAMAALAVVGIYAAYAGVRWIDPFLVVLLSFFGLPLVGGICAVVGILRQEYPIIFSILGLLANAAFPTIAIIHILVDEASGQGGMKFTP